MKYELLFEDFIKKITEFSYHQPKVLYFREFKSKNAIFTDVYIKRKNDFYYIQYGKMKHNNDSNLKIFCIDSPFELGLNNVAYDVSNNEVVSIKYYIPRKVFFLTDINSSNINFNCNCFNLHSKNSSFITFFDKRKFKKSTMEDVIDKYYKNDKDYKLLKYKIKENDNFTITSVV